MKDARDIQIEEYQALVRTLQAAYDQQGMELRAAQDKLEELQRSVRESWKEEIGRREKAIRELQGNVAGLTKIVQMREGEVREREDRINELNVEITRMAHPEMASVPES